MIGIVSYEYPKPRSSARRLRDDSENATGRDPQVIGAGVARGVRRGLRLASVAGVTRHAGQVARAVRFDRLSWHAQSRPRRGCEAAGAGGEGRRRHSSGGIGRRAERRAWRRAASRARAGGVRRGGGPAGETAYVRCGLSTARRHDA